jgi:hypothetical protein
MKLSGGDDQRRDPVKSTVGSIVLLVFGLMILAFLVAIDRPHWFELRPVSGAAAAMSHAAQPPSRS